MISYVRKSACMCLKSGSTSGRDTWSGKWVTLSCCEHNWAFKRLNSWCQEIKLKKRKLEICWRLRITFTISLWCPHSLFFEYLYSFLHRLVGCSWRKKRALLNDCWFKYIAMLLIFSNIDHILSHRRNTNIF